MGYKDETSEMLYIIYIIIYFRDLGIKCRVSETEGRISSLEMWICRRMLKISYKQHTSNVGLNVRPQLMKMIKERKCRFFWPYSKGERYENQLIARGQS